MPVRFRRTLIDTITGRSILWSLCRFPEEDILNYAKYFPFPNVATPYEFQDFVLDSQESDRPICLPDGTPSVVIRWVEQAISDISSFKMARKIFKDVESGRHKVEVIK